MIFLQWILTAQRLIYRVAVKERKKETKGKLRDITSVMWSKTTRNNIPITSTQEPQRPERVLFGDHGRAPSFRAYNTIEINRSIDEGFSKDIYFSR